MSALRICLAGQTALLNSAILLDPSLKNYFRYFFGDSASQKASVEGGPFHSLYDFSTTFGYGVYALTFETVIFLILIATGAAFIKGYAAKDAQGRVENKDKIMRNVFVLLIVVSLVTIVSTVFKIFSWK